MDKENNNVENNENYFFNHEEDTPLETLEEDTSLETPEEDYLEGNYNNFPINNNASNNIGKNLATGVNSNNNSKPQGDKQKNDKKINNNVNGESGPKRTNPIPGVNKSDYEDQDKQKKKKSKPNKGTKDNANIQQNSNKHHETNKKISKDKTTPKKLEKQGSVMKGGIAKGIKHIWELLPVTVKMGIILVGLVTIIFLFIVLVVVIVAGDYDDNNSFGGNCVGKTFDVPQELLDKSAAMTYTGALMQWIPGTGQDEFYKNTDLYIDDKGFLRSGEDYIIALGSKFGVKKGTRYQIEMADGKTFTALLADTKSDSDDTIVKGWAHKAFSGNEVFYNIIEFEMGCYGGSLEDAQKYKKLYNIGGAEAEVCSNKHHSNPGKTFPGNIKSISLVDPDENCDFNGTFTVRTSSFHTDEENRKKVFKLAPNLKILYNDYGEANGYWCQCVTYARLRTIEILANNNVLNNKQKKAAIDIMKNATHHGYGWVPSYIPALNSFSFDATCTDFKPGSIISWGQRAGHPYGHVAIIENVDYKNKKVTITEGGCTFAGQWNTGEWSFEDAKNKNGQCNGITHLLEFKG